MKMTKQRERNSSLTFTSFHWATDLSALRVASTSAPANISLLFLFIVDGSLDTITTASGRKPFILGQRDGVEVICTNRSIKFPNPKREGLIPVGNRHCSRVL